MSVDLRCPKCKHFFRLKDEHVGKMVRCPNCQTVVSGGKLRATSSGTRKERLCSSSLQPRGTGSLRNRHVLIYSLLGLLALGASVARAEAARTVLLPADCVVSFPAEWREVRTLRGGTGVVSFSPGWELLVLGGEDWKVKLWDVVTGKEVCTLKGYCHASSVCFSPDGALLASSGNGGTVKLWDVATGQQARTLEGRRLSIRSVLFSPDGTLLASGTSRGIVKLWDVATGREVRISNGHGGSVLSVSFSSDGKLLASGSQDHTVKLWDVATGQEVRTLKGHSSWVTSVRFSPDGTLLASGSRDKTVKLWEVATGKEVRMLEGHAGAVKSVSFSPDGTLLASGSRDKTVKLWDVATGQEVRTLSAHSGYVRSVSFSPDGKLLASGSEDETVKLWDVTMGQEVRAMRVHVFVGERFLHSYHSTNRSSSFSAFYAVVSRIAHMASRDDLASLVRDNPGYSMLLTQEMLRECVHDRPLNQRKLDLAGTLARLCRKIHGDGSLVDLVQRVNGFTPEQIEQSRGLTFLAAAHLFTSGDDEAVQEVVQAAPGYASLFVAECIIRGWTKDFRPLPPDAPPVLKKLDDPRVQPIAFAKRVAGAFERCYGDNSLMTATEIAERAPVVKGDAQCLWADGAYEDARRITRCAVQLASSLGCERAKVRSLVAAAEVYRQRADMAKAVKLLDQARRIAERTGDSGGQASVIAQRALLLAGTDKEEQVVASLREAVRRAEEAGEEADAGRFLASLASALLARGDYEAAKQVAYTALSAAGKLGEDGHSAAVAALYVVGKAEAATGHPAKAVDWLKRSIERGSKARTAAWRWEALFAIGQCYEKMASAGDADDASKRMSIFNAARHYEMALKAVEAWRGGIAQEEHKAIFSEDKADLYEALVRVCLKRGRASEAAAFAERGKGAAFLDRFGARSLKRRKARLEQEKRDLTTILDLAKAGKRPPEHLRDLYKRGSQISPGVHAPLSAVPKALKACDMAIKRLGSVDWAKVKSPFNLAVRTFKPKTEVLEYYLGKELACAFLLGRHSPKAIRIQAKPDEIAKLIDEFRAAAVESLTAQKLQSEAYREPLSKLYTLLVEPFEKELAGAEMVYIVPHGVLHYLPFQALIDRDGKYLIEKVNIAYTPSLNVLRHCRAANMGNRESLLAVANPDTGWDPLPATEKEAAAVSALFKGHAQVTTGADATEKLVKDKAPQFDVLTFPTHGEMVWKEPTKSNLRFTPGEGEDGRWTVQEIFEMDLKANLVALSACETGLAGGYAGKLPEADDFVGLTRAFMFAGAPSVVGSLWKVADDSAVTLMSEFFTNWKTRGMDKAEALRAAQLAMIRGEVNLGMVVRGTGGMATVDAAKVQAETGANLGRHPYFWAPFVLIGDYK